MKFRQKPNGIWVVDYEDDSGKRRRVSTGIKTPPQRHPPAEVKVVGREIVLGVRDPQQSASPARQARSQDGRLTMRELFDKCELTVWHPDNVRSQATIRSNVKLLNELIGDVAVEDMNFSRLEQLIADMKGRDYKPGTIKRKLAMVGKALKMATMWSDERGEPLLRHRPPFPQVVVKNTKDRIISPVEEEAFFAALEKRRQEEPSRQWFAFRVYLWLLFDTGGRLSETLAIGPSNIAQRKVGDQEVSFLTFSRHTTKSGKPRTLPLAPRSVAALGTLMDHLTVDKKTGQWRFFGFTKSSVDVMFRQLRQDVMQETGMDVADVTVHTIRHTVLTRLAQGGMELARLQQWAGHSDPKITAERYLHLTSTDLVGGLEFLSGAGGTPDAYQARVPTKPVSVPDTLPSAIRANPGTVSLN